MTSNTVKIILVPFVGLFMMMMSMSLMYIFESTDFGMHKMEPLRMLMVIINTSFAVALYYFIISKMNQHKGWCSIWYLRLLADVVIIFVHSFLFILIARTAVEIGWMEPIPGHKEEIIFIMPPVVHAMIMIILEMILSIEARNKLSMQLTKMEKEHINAKYGALKEQLDHHFLFNNLSVLSSLIYESTEKADHFIQDFASTYRYVLTINQQKLVTLEDELAFIDKYLSLYKYRFEDGFDFKLNIEAKYCHYLLPPLTLQLLVENVIKHNAVSKKEPLRLNIYTEAGKLIVKNSIHQKIEKVDSTQKGQANLLEKYRLLNHELPTFGTSDKHYLVSISLIESHED